MHSRWEFLAVCAHSNALSIDFNEEGKIIIVNRWVQINKIEIGEAESIQYNKSNKNSSTNNNGALYAIMSVKKVSNDEMGKLIYTLLSFR